MKKVININFQGRVIPIEETAYEMLQQYVESLRTFFANEEGRDEIINDIEGRIAELFAETLKKGAICITDEDVTTIINSMGRPQDFEAEEASVKSQLSGEGYTDGREKSYSYNATGSKKLYRDETHKLLGGVCSGIANYFTIDPIIIRILFIVFVGIGGLGLLAYFILWIVVPGSSTAAIGSQRRRLFRDVENKTIAGVCAGLSQYFSVPVWVPRVLFLIPFFSFVFRWGHWGLWDFPHFLSFSFSPGSIVVYIILWLLLPEAVSAADKLEMKGEKVDLNTIKTTIQGDLAGFKDRAQAFGSELTERARAAGESLTAAGTRAGAEATIAGKKAGSGLAHVLTVLIKMFIYLIVGSIVLSVVVGLFGAGIASTGLLSAYSSYVLDSGYQEMLAWGSLIFFVWVPVIAIVTWIIRRLTGKKGNRGIIRLTFLSLWILGVICFVNLLISIGGDFRYRNYPVEEPVSLSNASVNRLDIKTTSRRKYYDDNWLRLEPFNSFSDDTVYVSNVRLRIIKSTTDSFQVYMVKMANAGSKSKADEIASRINFNIAQTDSTLLLDKGIAITQRDKFRNQQVIVTVAVPVGKRFYVNENVGWGNNVRVTIGRNNDYRDWEENEETEALSWRHGVEYMMTEKGLKRADQTPDKWNSDNDDEERNDAIEDFKSSREKIEKEKQQKLRELQEIDRELQKTIDSTRYPAAPGNPAKPSKPKQIAKVNQPAGDVPSGISDLLMIKFSL